MKVALFDMDLVAYRAAAAIEKRSVEVLHKSSGSKKVFNTRTEFKEFLEKQGRVYVPENYLFTDIQNVENESHAYQIVKSQVQSITNALDAEYTECFVGGKDNFRLLLDLPNLYKGARKDMLRPILLEQTKKYALGKYAGGLIEGHEVDDHVVIRSHELIKAGHEAIVITLDKDQWGCVGTSFYNWTEDKPKVVQVPVFGYLEYNKEKKKVLGLGLNFYCYQLLKGDSSDDYSPSDLHKKKFGDVGAVNYLKDCKTVNDLFTATEDKFKEWFPNPITYTTHKGTEVTKDYSEVIHLYHQCVYMHRVLNDTTTFYDLWKEFK